MPEPSQVLVLVEDSRHATFVRRYLKRLGFTNHGVRIEPLPAGRGCGEQWVRENYSRLVRQCRSRSSRAATALIVAIDADTGTVNDRVNQLRRGLDQTGLAARDAREKIVHLIPRRNIETWVLCLNGRTDVEEEDDYKREIADDQPISAAAEKFFVWSRPNAQVPNHCLPSLRAAFPEVRRLDD